MESYGCPSEPYGTLQNHMGPYGNILVSVGTLWDLAETYGCPSEPYGTLCMEPYGNICVSIGSLWKLRGTYGNIRVRRNLMEPYGTLWKHTGVRQTFPPQSFPPSLLPVQPKGPSWQQPRLPLSRLQPLVSDPRQVCQI